MRCVTAHVENQCEPPAKAGVHWEGGGWRAGTSDACPVPGSRARSGGSGDGPGRKGCSCAAPVVLSRLSLLGRGTLEL